MSKFEISKIIKIEGLENLSLWQNSVSLIKITPFQAFYIKPYFCGGFG